MTLDDGKPMCSEKAGPSASLSTTSGVPRGGGVSGVQPPSRNSEGPPKNRAKLNPIVKTVKEIAEFRTPTHQDVRKKRQ